MNSYLENSIEESHLPILLSGLESSDEQILSNTLQFIGDLNRQGKKTITDQHNRAKIVNLFSIRTKSTIIRK